MCYTSGVMQVQFETKNFDTNKKQDHAVDKRLKKLSRLCKMFDDELVNLHINIEHKQPPEGFEVHLTLSVPNKQMAAVTKNKRFSMAVGEAFKKVMAQLRKFKGQLRNGNNFSEAAKAKGKI